MPIIRKYAIQGHAVPNGYRPPRGPFPAEILAQNPVSYEVDHGDSLHEALDNVRLFRCKYCLDVMYDYQVDSHDCEE